MTRVLAIDYGQRRIGLAISDPSRVIAQMPEPYVTHDPLALSKLSSLVKKYEIAEIIIGLPLSLSGTEGRAARAARDFAERLGARVRIPIRFVDERLSTKQAQRLLRADTGNQDRKRAQIDNLAAYVLLQQYLDTHTPKKI